MVKKMGLTMAALASLEDLANAAISQERVFRERDHSLADEDSWLKSQFWLPWPVSPNVIGAIDCIARLRAHNL